MPRKPKPDSEHHVNMTISFHPDDYKHLMSYCEREERSAAWVVRKALREWFEKHDKGEEG